MDAIGLLAILVWIAVSSVPMVANHFTTELSCEPVGPSDFHCSVHRRVFFDLLDFPTQITGELSASKHAGRSYRINRDPFTKRGVSVLKLYAGDDSAVRLEPIGVFIDTPGMAAFPTSINAGFEAQPRAPFEARIVARNALGWAGSVLVCLGLVFLGMFFLQRQRRWRGVTPSRWDPVARGYQ